VIAAACFVHIAFAQSNESAAVFTIKYVTADVVYIEGGSAAGLSEGMTLAVKRPETGESPIAAPVLGELKVVSVASTSAACEIVRTDTDIRPGDLALADPAQLAAARQASGSADETFAQVVEFSGDEEPLDRELRESIPKPPLPEVNRFRGRIGFESDSIFDRTATGARSQQMGITLRTDITRIGSSYWSLSGYWRGRMQSRKREATQESLRDTLQRVYQFGLRYDSPESSYVAGVGRLLVPWASSLSTIDGGYFGRKMTRATTLGLFAGSTPDPTAWSYDPDRQMAGVFVSTDRGSFDRVRHTATVGVAVSRQNWRPERQFLFAENGLAVNSGLTIRHSLEADYQSSGRFQASSPVAVTRSFFTLRLQPVRRIAFDVSHSYFRILPTFDSRLVSAGVVDNALFQGLSGGARVDLPYGFTVYGSAGRSSRTEDRTPSWSHMAGLVTRIPGVGFRGDFRYSRFDGAIGAGEYRSASLLKESSERWRLEIQAGDQSLRSSIAAASRSQFIMTSADWFISRFVLGGSATRYRGGGQYYDQALIHLDYRF
jgi:hypothetical protein